MNDIDLDNYESTEKLTARVFFNPYGDGLQDIGNVLSWTRAKDNELSTRARSEGGARIVDREEQNSVHDAWEFVHDEFNSFNNRILNDADRTDSEWVDQNAEVSASESIQHVYPGHSYFVSKRALSGFSLSVASVLMTPGIDYSINFKTGEIKILESGSILAGEGIDLVYDSEDRGLQRQDVQGAFDFKGPVKFQLFNLKSGDLLYEVNGTASCNITAFPEHSGEFGKFTSRWMFSEGVPTITKRNAFDTSGKIVEPVYTLEGLLDLELLLQAKSFAGRVAAGTAIATVDWLDDSGKERDFPPLSSTDAIYRTADLAGGPAVDFLGSIQSVQGFGIATPVAPGANCTHVFVLKLRARSFIAGQSAGGDGVLRGVPGDGNEVLLWDDQIVFTANTTPLDGDQAHVLFVRLDDSEPVSNDKIKFRINKTNFAETTGLNAFPLGVDFVGAGGGLGSEMDGLMGLHMVLSRFVDDVECNVIYDFLRSEDYPSLPE